MRWTKCPTGPGRGWGMANKWTFVSMWTLVSVLCVVQAQRHFPSDQHRHHLHHHPRRPGGVASRRRQDVIEDWIRNIRQSPKAHSISPSWSGQSPYQVIGVSELPLQNEPNAAKLDRYTRTKRYPQEFRAFSGESDSPGVQERDVAAGGSRRQNVRGHPRHPAPHQRHLPATSVGGPPLRRPYNAATLHDGGNGPAPIRRRFPNLGPNPFLGEEHEKFPRQSFEAPPRPRRKNKVAAKDLGINAGIPPRFGDNKDFRKSPNDLGPPPSSLARQKFKLRNRRPNNDHRNGNQRHRKEPLQQQPFSPPELQHGFRPFYENRPATNKFLGSDDITALQYEDDDDDVQEDDYFLNQRTPVILGRPTPRPIPTPGPEDFPVPPPTKPSMPPTHPTHPTHPPPITHPPQHYEIDSFFTNLQDDNDDDTNSYFRGGGSLSNLDNHRLFTEDGRYVDRGENSDSGEDDDYAEGFFQIPDSFPSLAALGGFESMKIRNKRSADQDLMTEERRLIPVRGPAPVPRQRLRAARDYQRRNTHRRQGEFGFQPGFWEEVETDFFDSREQLPVFGQRNQPYVRRGQSRHTAASRPSYYGGSRESGPYETYRSTASSFGRHRDPYPQQSVQSYPLKDDEYFSRTPNDIGHVADDKDNEILGSGNFEVIKGGTFYDEDTYYQQRYNSRPQYNYGGDFFKNFRDFADIKGDVYSRYKY